MSYFEWLTNQEDYPSGEFLTRSNLPPIQARLKEIVAPTAEPITLDEAKLWIRQDEGVDGEENALINSLISGARRVAERYTRSVFMPRTMLLTRDRPPQGSLDIFLPPLISVDEVAAYRLDNSKTIVDPSTYFVDESSTKLPARIFLNVGQIWPTSLRKLANFEVKFQCGYADAATVPEPIKTAIKIILDNWYHNREAAGKQEIPGDAKTLLREFQVIKL